MADDMSSLLSLEEELTCSICLSPFESPVTTPCGHNFCRGCLDLTWRDSEQTGLGFNCPQCRSHFVTKPELRKNTVLDAVVDKFKLKSKADIFSDVMTTTTTKTEPDAAPIICDVCMEGKACKTCLTCMVSYCVEHVRPHLENPVFGAHQLYEPLADLQERICPDHSKMMEFFCVQHRRCICSFCLQQEHKGCTFCTPDEQRVLRESDLKKKLSQLYGKIEKTQLVLSQMKEQQSVLKDSATNRKRELEMVYRQIREMLDRDEQQAVKSVDKEEEGAQSRLFSMMKKFNQNMEEMSGARDRITRLLAQTQSLAFLQASVDLPSAVDFEPYAPRLNINTKRAHLESAAALKEYLENILKQPVDSRVALLKPASLETPPSIMSTAKRSDLLKYGTVLTLDHRTAHKRIVLSENFTKASVSEEPAAYPNSPARFSVCSQVLCTKGFSQGRHYWEVEMTSNNFCGVGLAYNSIDRKGPASRLGRNAQSWCVEWFNNKLSAWHDSSETVLAIPSPSHVGVLLDCAEGTATFYNVADRAYPFHTFVYPFCDAVYPAFWIFSSGTAITLSLQADQLRALPVPGAQRSPPATTPTSHYPQLPPPPAPCYPHLLLPPPLATPCYPHLPPLRYPHLPLPPRYPHLPRPRYPHLPPPPATPTSRPPPLPPPPAAPRYPHLPSPPATPTSHYG